MKVDFGVKTWLLPMPVLIIGTYDENGIPDAMNAAWGGIYDYNKVGICISESHKTTQNILKKGEFTVSFADAKNIVAADYVGIVSGNKTPDKIAKAGLTPVKANHIDAPLFDEFPMALECKLCSYDNASGYMIADIVNVCVDDNCIVDGEIDVSKVNPIIFETIHSKYYTLGDVVGTAFSDGKKLI